MNKVDLYRLPRSGSTMILRALRAVGCLGRHGHSLIPSGGPLVITVRDFRDVVVSHWRIWDEALGRDLTEKTLNSAMVRTDLQLEQLAVVKAKVPDAVIWRYEDHYNNPEELCRFICRVCDTDLTDSDRDTIADICDPDAATALADAVPRLGHRPFRNFDEDTRIHADHLGPAKGKPGHWKAVVPSLLRPGLTSHYRTQLLDWGYDPEA